MYARERLTIATPIGALTVSGSDAVVEGIVIGGEAGGADRVGSPALNEAAVQLRAYFAGALTRFDLPLAPTTTTRGEVLRRGMVAISYGETVTYGTLAARLGSSARAIGGACRRNPFPIVVPCHRVLSAGDVLGFYSAGNGPATKQLLLDHERRHGVLA